jgi:hypothetical protein
MFRFTIRDVLLLTAVVGLAAGWSLDHARQTAVNRTLIQQREAEQRFAKLRAKELQGKVIISRGVW